MLIRRTAVVLAVALIASLVLGSSSPAAVAPARYIVVLNGGTNPTVVAAEHARRHGAGVRFVYEHALRGYAATIPHDRVAAVRADGRVSYVVPDGTAQAVVQTLPWGIDKIDADLSPTALAGNGSGAVTNVRAYIIDTGIDTAHTDLNVVGHVNYAGGQNKDCNGHGTHVAGTVAARDNAQDVVGVAPGAPLVGVKVLGCSGSGTWSGVIKGIDYVTARVQATGTPAIANMSLGGGANQAVDDAVVRSATPTATYRGVLYAIAAGNQGANACNSSPARVGAGSDNGIVTTAATTSSDAEASWSNFGPCVDIWAPGVSILSTRRGGGTTTMSGTSMASPHTGGAGALWLSTHTSQSPAAVEGALKASATTSSNKSKDGVRTIIRLSVGAF
jgi:subtilisin family serine protease